MFSICLATIREGARTFRRTVSMLSISFRHYLPSLLTIAGFALLGALFSYQIGAHAQDTDDDTDPSSATTTPVDELATEGQRCSECHLDVTQAWQDSTHAQAYADPRFQTEWVARGEDPSCLACHTTGFVPRTGTFDHPGVTCEACHGQTPANHPEVPVSVDPGVRVCADCHPTTVDEWEISGHGEQNIACVACHNPHPQEIRQGDVNTLCLSCHEDNLSGGFAHETHMEQECADCHWHYSEVSEEHFINGSLLPSGHDGVVETQACTDCHVEMDEDFTAIANELNEDLPPDHPLLEARVRITELEAEVETVDAQGQNAAAVSLIQGLLVGAAIGGIVIFGGARLLGSRREEEERHE